MSWKRLYNSTTIDANDFNENFKAIRSGDLLPLKLSTSLSYTTGVYDLGSESYKWNNVYVNYLKSHGIITEQNITGDTTTGLYASLNTFTKDIIRFKAYIDGEFINSTTIVYLRINSVTSNYNYYSTQEGTKVSQSYIQLIKTDYNPNAEFHLLTEGLISCHQDFHKVLLINVGVWYGSNLRQNNNIIAMIDISTLTSIQIEYTGLNPNYWQNKLIIERLF